MPTSSLRPFDPERDLVLQRVIPVPLAKVWEAWTTPEQLKQWFCPLPWKVVACEVDLRPGGVFGTTMRGPAGEEHASEGCYLEIVPHKRLVWTDGLGPGFRPAEKAFMTGILELEAQGSSTLYTATVLHANSEIRQQHEAMGFQQGWGAALDQLVAMIQA
ncbi:MAG: SRPBCC family protein [Planctomycetes bacterium]|nr:SRPBCC family protein [Planctomycetota bacterium]